MTFVRLMVTFWTRLSVKQHPKSVTFGGAFATRLPQLKIGGVRMRPLTK